MRKALFFYLFLGSLFFLTWWMLSDLSFKWGWETGWPVHFIAVFSMVMTIGFSISLWLLAIYNYRKRSQTLSVDDYTEGFHTVCMEYERVAQNTNGSVKSKE